MGGGGDGAPCRRGCSSGWRSCCCCSGGMGRLLSFFFSCFLFFGRGIGEDRGKGGGGWFSWLFGSSEQVFFFFCGGVLELRIDGDGWWLSLRAGITWIGDRRCRVSIVFFWFHREQ